MTFVTSRALRIALLGVVLLVPTSVAALGITAPTAPTPLEPAALPTTEAAAPAVFESYMVGYGGSFPSTLLKALGIKVGAVHPDAGFALVETTSPELLQGIAGVLGFNYVVRNGVTTYDGAQWDAAQWDASQWDASQWDSARWDASQWDAAQWDASQWDASQWDSSTWDASRWDSASWDASRWDASRWDASRWDASRWDGKAADPGFSNDWHLGAIHALDAWNVTTAYHAVTICIVDSGVDYTHSDIYANMRKLSDGSFGYDFVNNDKDPMDDGGHGTYMAGIAAATMGNGHGVAGVSQAYVIAAKVLDSTGTGTEANLALAIRWCVDTGGAKIISLSLHTEQDNNGVHDAVKYARSKGSLVLAAAGNSGQVCDACVAYPAAYNEAMGIGASAPDGTRAPFSNGGKQLSFLAPGVSIPGPYPGDQYVVGSGTSQATAVAAGAAALTLAAKPSLSPDQLRDAIMKSAKDAGTAGFDNSYGYGLLRVDKAFARVGVSTS